MRIPTVEASAVQLGSKGSPTAVPTRPRTMPNVRWSPPTAGDAAGSVRRGLHRLLLDGVEHYIIGAHGVTVCAFAPIVRGGVGEDHAVVVEGAAGERHVQLFELLEPLAAADRAGWEGACCEEGGASGAELPERTGPYPKNCTLRQTRASRRCREGGRQSSSRPRCLTMPRGGT